MAIHHRILDCFAALAMTLMLLLATPVNAQTFPELTGRVVDQAELLTPPQEQELSSKSAALEAQTGRQLVVATVANLEGRTIEDYGYRLGRHWAIGSEAEDDGIILLVAPNEKKVRIETGYGARVFLPDVLAGRIIRNDILPRFRDGDMPGGIMAGADAIIEHASLPPEQARQRAAEAAAEQARANEGGASFVPLVVGGMVLFFVILGMSRRVSGHRYHRHGKRARRRSGFDAGDAAIILWGLSELAEGAGRRGRGGGWGGGFGGFGGGGGFGGFSGGGGSFGGGGASGGW